MAFSKEDRRNCRVLRWIKTLFFLATMLVSLLLLSAPVLLLIADAILPSSLLSAAPSSSPASISLQSLSSHLSNYDFRYSLIDIPLISIVRSAIILCVYSLCDGPRLSRGPYLGIATICSVSSLVFLSLKAGYIFGNYSSSSSGSNRERLGHTVVDVALFTCSFFMAIAHIVMAYRISCRERRKLLVFKIDIETVSPKGDLQPDWSVQKFSISKHVKL
nr:Regulatory protein [Ipomoea batatas]